MTVPARSGRRRRPTPWQVAVVALTLCAASVLSIAAADQVYFPSVTNVTNLLVQRINAETVRLDIGTWYLTEHAVSIAIANRFHAGVPVRLLGDRGSIFEIDANTRREFYWLASQGVPIRLRYDPWWYPEINHWKMGIFVGQGIVEFGSANWTAYELAPDPNNPNNYNDNTTMFTDDPQLVEAFKIRFDRIWNDTTAEPGSIPASMGGGPPYLKNWDEACALEYQRNGACWDYSSYKAQQPNWQDMHIDTRRLVPDSSTPPPVDLIWGQGSQFNDRLVTEINNENSLIQFVIYRLTVDNITQALLNRWRAGVQVRLIVEPNEYLNRKWPEFWLTHANLDKLWAAGIPMIQRSHQGLTHMKTLVTSKYASNASSNYAAAWQRDHNYFVPAATKPAVYNAIRSQVEAMWINRDPVAGFAPFKPQAPDAANLASPPNGSPGVATSTPFVWNTAAFATSYDVYLGTSTSNMKWVANVPAQLDNNPPTTYSYPPPPGLLQGGTSYVWGVISRTFATGVNNSICPCYAVSPIWAFSTAGSGGGVGPLPAPWSSQDVGAVGPAGSASYSNGTFTVRGAGANIWGSADSFRYVYQQANGNLQMWARVTSMQNTNPSAKAGVMLRESLAPNAAHVVLNIKPNGGIEFMTRSSTGAQTTYLAGSTSGLPEFVGFVRNGSTVTGYVSSNGSSWTAVGSVNFNVGSSVLAGMVVCAANTSTLNTSTFDTAAVQMLP
jgi:phosphatidylserine/phosphatidylglycerophosphate/cardiolipin synthase-like enzyme